VSCFYKKCKKGHKKGVKRKCVFLKKIIALAGKWENGKMGKWENGKMGKWENGKMGKIGKWGKGQGKGKEWLGSTVTMALVEVQGIRGKKGKEGERRGKEEKEGGRDIERFILGNWQYRIEDLTRTGERNDPQALSPVTAMSITHACKTFLIGEQCSRASPSQMSRQTFCKTAKF
jgi:hypothetical protein